MTDTFLLFPNNEAFVRGEKTTPQNSAGVLGSGCMILFLMPFVTASIFLILFCLNMLYDGFLLSQNSVQTVGQVTDMDEDYDDGDTTYWIDYQYMVADRMYTKRQSVSGEIYAAHQIEQPIDITYAGRDATVAHITGIDSTPLNLFLLGFTVIWVGIVSVFTTVIISQMQRSRRLQREGKILCGELVSIKGEKGEDDYMVTAVVRFRSPSTLQPVNGKRRYTCNHLEKSRLPTQGAPVAIHYADDTVWEVL